MLIAAVNCSWIIVPTTSICRRRAKPFGLDLAAALFMQITFPHF